MCNLLNVHFPKPVDQANTANIYHTQSQYVISLFLYNNVQMSNELDLIVCTARDALLTKSISLERKPSYLLRIIYILYCC